MLQGGQVLVSASIGGGIYDNDPAYVEFYDPATGTWRATGAPMTPRISHTATLLPNGQVLISAGYGISYLSDAEVYYPSTGTWSTAGTLSTTRTYHTATLLQNGKVLVVGGGNSASSGGTLATAELYDPAVVPP